MSSLVQENTWETPSWSSQCPISCATANRFRPASGISSRTRMRPFLWFRIRRASALSRRPSITTTPSVNATSSRINSAGFENPNLTHNFLARAAGVILFGWLGVTWCALRQCLKAVNVLQQRLQILIRCCRFEFVEIGGPFSPLELALNQRLEAITQTLRRWGSDLTESRGCTESAGMGIREFGLALCHSECLLNPVHSLPNIDAKAV